MNEDNEFQGIGKKMNYKVPDGFFEHVSEITLLKAKQREKNRRKSMVLWRSVAVAASLIGIALFGYYNWDTSKTETKIVAAQGKTSDSAQSIHQLQSITKQPIVTEIRRIEPEMTIGKDKNPENLNDVLVDLSEDELQQLVAIYKTDPFISESEE